MNRHCGLVKMYKPDESFFFVNEDNVLRKGLVGKKDVCKIFNFTTRELEFLVGRIFVLYFSAKEENEPVMNFENCCYTAKLFSKKGNFIDKINAAFNIFDVDADGLLSWSECLYFLLVANQSREIFLSVPECEIMVSDLLLTHGVLPKSFNTNCKDLPKDRMMKIKNFYDLVTGKEVLLKFLQMDMDEQIRLSSTLFNNFSIHECFESANTRKSDVVFLRPSPNASVINKPAKIGIRDNDENEPSSARSVERDEETMGNMKNFRLPVAANSILSAQAAMPAIEMRKRKAVAEFKRMAALKSDKIAKEPDEFYKFPSLRNIEAASLYADNKHTFNALVSSFSSPDLRADFKVYSVTQNCNEKKLWSLQHPIIQVKDTKASILQKELASKQEQQRKNAASLSSLPLSAIYHSTCQNENFPASAKKNREPTICTTAKQTSLLKKATSPPLVLKIPDPKVLADEKRNIVSSRILSGSRSALALKPMAIHGFLHYTNVAASGACNPAIENLWKMLYAKERRNMVL